MVMPCYNKIEYIGNMFDSIVAQEWDNIELILVNDGSTDGTQDVIVAYEPRFQERGYSVIIINQENLGVCAAAKAGLERVTGDYICMVDADDELDLKYVSTMAECLEKHEEYDYCMCGFSSYTGSGKNKEQGIIWLPQTSELDVVIEDYLFCSIRPAVWAYMVRKAYFLHCRIAETYITNTMGSHEPSFLVPLIANGGKAKFIYSPLYFHNSGVEGAHSQHHSFDKMFKHYDEYFELVGKAISRLSEFAMNTARKQQLYGYIDYYRLCTLYARAKDVQDEKCAELLFNDILVFVSNYFMLNLVTLQNATSEMKSQFLNAIHYLLSRWGLPITNISFKRVIGYGALGRAAAKLLPQLRETILEPTELWDVNGNGIDVNKPAFETLNEEDIVLIFPVGNIECSLRSELGQTRFRIMYNSDIQTCLFALILLNNARIFLGE